MPFTNEVIGSNGVLIRNTLQSQNYVPGVSGWQITKSGNAEFNNGTFRGSIISGNVTGKHIVLNNLVTGHAVDVYDDTNSLVAYINSIGQIGTRLADGSAQAYTLGGSLTLTQDNDQGLFSMQAHTATQGAALIIDSFSPTEASGDGQLVVWSSGTGGSAQPATVTAIERGHSGSIVVTDGLSTNNLMHAAIYNVSTDAGGSSTFNHGASFTPKIGILAGVNGIGANFPYQYAWFGTPFTSTTAHAAFKDNLGAALASTTLGVFGIFFG
jgi:hypothetical protein